MHIIDTPALLPSRKVFKLFGKAALGKSVGAVAPFFHNGYVTATALQIRRQATDRNSGPVFRTSKIA